MNDRKPPEGTGTEKPMEAQQTTAKKGKGQAALGREIQAKIGQQLRAYYDALIEPTPSRFSELVRQLDKPDSKESPE